MSASAHTVSFYFFLLVFFFLAYDSNATRNRVGKIGGLPL